MSDEVKDELIERIEEFCQKIAQSNKRPVLVYPEYGRRFTRIVVEDGSHRHVHAFVDSTGDVIKAAGWKAPQRGANGLAVRFNLLDDDSRERAFRFIDPHGGYLYEGVLDSRATAKV